MSASGDAPTSPPRGPLDFHPTSQQVDDLISRAREHPLGLEFLERGALDAVAAEFGAHAFVVDAARERLRRR